MAKDISTLELTVHNRPQGVALTRWLCGELQQAIADGRLRPGSRLPATRELARQYGISRGTVVAAFDRLTQAGYLRGRVGSGTWVTSRVSKRPSPRRKADYVAGARPGPLAGLSFRHPAKPFRLHEPAVEEFPIRVWSRLSARRMRKGSASLLVGTYPGTFPPLCEAIADYLGTVRGVKCTPDQIAVTSGVQQALDLIARLLLRPGDAVWVEDPGYFGANLAFTNARATLIPVPVDSEGLRVKDAEDTSAAAKCAYVTPGHQFPLGSTMSPARRQGLLAWARRNRAFIIEDDYDSEFRFDGDPVPSLKSLDRDERVILVGTFNKLLFPSIRLGYAVLPDQLVDRFYAYRYGTDLNGMSFQQCVLCDFITEGHLSRHMRRMRVLYGARLSVLQEAARQELGGLFDVSPVRAGLYTVGFLRSGIGSAAAEAAGLKHGVETMGLHRFTLAQPDACGLLLGFAAFDETRIRYAVGQLRLALSQRQT